MEKTSRLELIRAIQDIWGGYIVWDSINKTVSQMCIRDRTSGDIVFFVYEHGAEGTIPETEISYYDSRYVIKGEDDKFYQWEIEAKLVEGVITPSIKLVEV